MKKLFFVFVLTAAFAACLAAQDVFATIEGTVLDPSGAPVPKAKVSVTNVDRNQVVKTVQTDASGVYSATLLPIGNYSVKVEANGFRTETRTGIVLNVSDDLKINITMQVGQVTEAVEVKEDPVQVETGTATSSTTITGEQVRELGLNTRNYEALVALMPGVAIKANPADQLFIGNSSPSGLSAQIPYSVNGNRNSANNWLVDGADNVDRGANLTLMTFPSVDSIAEFKVERSLYTADTGRAGGAQINVVTKSGTSEYHGDLYEFLRNDKLAANNWANNANSVLVNGKVQVPPIRWNDFGGTIGGPVPLGGYNRDKNKTFFFFSEEARRIHTYTTLNPVLPTPAMLTGNFPQPVCVTAVNSTCPTGATPVTQIPTSQINPIVSEYIKDIFGKLNLPSTITSGFYPVQNIFNSRQEVIRIDQRFSDRFAIWGKFENDAIPTVEPGGLFTGSAIPYVAITDTNSPGKNAVVHAVNSITPTMANDGYFNFSQSGIQSSPQGLMAKANSPDINVPEPFANTQGVLPELTWTGGSTLVGYGPYHERNRNLAFADSLIWIKGRHTLKFGGIFTLYNKTENAANQEGAFGFSNGGVPSGTSSYYQSWANFLLGNVSSFSMPSNDITPNLSQKQLEAYAQDDFKITSRLSLSMGVRWSFFGQLTGANHLLDNFAPSLYNPSNAPKIDPTTGNIIAGTGNNFQTNGIIVAGVNSPWGDHVGNQVWTNFAPRLGLAWDPFGDGKTAIRTGFGVFYDSAEIGRYESNVFVNPPYVQSITISNAPLTNIQSGTVGVSLAPLAIDATQLPALVPYSMNWSLDLERRLPGRLLLDIGYFGSKGTHLQGIVDIDQAPPGAALAAGLHAANGNTIFTTADDPHINAIRPYLGFSAINTIETAFDSNFHSLQVAIRKNFGSVGQIDVSYTWGKVLTDSGSDSGNAPQSSYNWHEGEYGPYPGDRQQVLTLDYIYKIPAFAHGHGLLHQALGGWEVSGIPTWYTGTPFTVTTSSVDPAGLGLLGASASSSRPDMVCDPRANQPQQYIAVTGAGKPTWFNTACFQPVPQGTVRPGNAGRGVVRGPGYFNWDFFLYKNFLYRERFNLQIRGEAYNVLNWVNPGALASTNITSTAFGEINSYRQARLVQVGAKLIF